MHEILDETLKLLAAGRPFALVTLVADRGSTPRAAGAEMLVRDDGSIAGTIGGGLLEHTMMQAAAEALAERRSRRVSADLSGADLRSAEKMVCGGSAEVLIAFVPAGDAELLAACSALREARDAGRRAWYVTVPAGDAAAAVEHCVLDEDGRLAGAAVCEAAALRGLTAAAELHGTAHAAGRPLRGDRARRPAGARRGLRRRARRDRGRAAPRAAGIPRGRRRRPGGVRDGPSGSRTRAPWCAPSRARSRP